MFSPYYAASRRRGQGDPAEHCALNVAIYSGRRSRWAMTDRGGQALQRSATELAIGPSRVEWGGDALTFRIDEVAVPLPFRIRGSVTIRPRMLFQDSFSLDPAGRHAWQPIAPLSRVEVRLESPALTWNGDGYFDINAGDEPLEDAFESWNWSCARLPGGAAILYDVEGRRGDATTLALRFDETGRLEPFNVPPATRLPRTAWGLTPKTRSEEGPATVRRRLENGPFYARSVISTGLLGERVTAMHESLSLARFRQRWVQALLPFRMPRVAA